MCVSPAVEASRISDVSVGDAYMDKGDRQRAAWALYEWAQQPYWALIATFIFTPYFAAGFVGDPARG